MKTLALFVAACVTLGSSLSSSAQSPKPDRQVAVTIDDLPSGMADRLPATEITALTAKLLGTLRDQKVPAVGFVNEKKLYKPGEVDERIKALQMWVEYGFELGNHTFGHASLNQVGLPLSLNADQVFKSGAAGATLFIGPTSIDLNGKNLIVSSNGTTTISATIIGAGSLTKLGNSILNLSVSNSYVGPTFVLEHTITRRQIFRCCDLQSR